jgi:putative Holliday junction resolvase
MRALSVDFGLKRVGLALSDPTGTLAYPLRTIARGGKDALYAELLRTIEAERVEAVVVGLPLAMDGTDTLTTRQVRNFASGLRHRAAVPVHLADERLSSAEAECRLREAGAGRGRIKAALDSQAAVCILESFLQSRRQSGQAGLPGDAADAARLEAGDGPQGAGS